MILSYSPSVPPQAPRRTFLSPLFLLITHRSSLVALLLCLLLPACKEKAPTTPPITLYTSMDAGIVTPIINQFQTDTGIPVRIVTDTEATKTTGLAQRLINEKSAPIADVWWSSEVVATIQLQNAGILKPELSLVAEQTARGWPESLRSPTNHWYGLALRPRIIVWNTSALQRDKLPHPPRSLNDLKDPRFAAKGVGIANPAFGTTRGHLAASLAALGRKEFSALLSAIPFKIYDGNAAVVRAVATGEVDIGLTDFDDLVAGQAQGWPLDGQPIRLRSEEAAILCIPGTIALIDRPAADEQTRRNTRQFVDYILTRGVERTLAESTWRSIPVLRSGETLDPRLATISIAPINWDKAAEVLEESARLWSTRANPTP